MLVTARGPSPHLTFAEIACRDGTPYPKGWVVPRLVPLAATFEVIRAALGGQPLRVTSGYRTREYNARIGGAPASQHVEGRALDLQHATLAPAEVAARILALYQSGALPLLGGLGTYPGFTHIDVRPNLSLARWGADMPEKD